MRKPMLVRLSVDSWNVKEQPHKHSGAGPKVQLGVPQLCFAIQRESYFCLVTLGLAHPVYKAHLIDLSHLLCKDKDSSKSCREINGFSLSTTRVSYSPSQKQKSLGISYLLAQGFCVMCTCMTGTQPSTCIHYIWPQHWLSQAHKCLSDGTWAASVQILDRFKFLQVSGICRCVVSLPLDLIAKAMLQNRCESTLLLNCLKY